MDVPSYLLCSKFLFPFIVYHNTEKEKRENKKITKMAIRTKKSKYRYENKILFTCNLNKDEV